MLRLGTWMMLFAALAVGCASRQPEPLDNASSATDAEKAPATGDASQSTDRSGPNPQREREAEAGRRRGMSRAALEMWNDPSFRKQFVESYKAETEIEPQVTAAEAEKLQKVLDLMRQDRMEKARKLIEDQMTDASSPVFDYTLANIHFQQERFDRAAEWYTQAVEAFPKFRRAWRNLAMVHVRQDAFDKALPALIRVVELGGGDGLTYGLLGYAHAAQGNSMAAESAYRMASLLEPETLDWKMGLARSFFRQERYGEAASLCDHLLKRDPDRTDLWLLQANAYLGMDRPLDAAENYELVREMGAATFETLAMLGDIYVNEKLYPLAVDAYIAAMKEKPASPPDRMIRAARVMAAQGALAQTDRLVTRVESRDGASLSAEQRKQLLRLRARVAAASGGGKKEAEVLKEIVELDPLDGQALIQLGQYYARTGRISEAIAKYEHAANIEGFKAKAMIRHAELLVREQKYQEALPLLKRAQKIEYRENVQDYIRQVEAAAKTG